MSRRIAPDRWQSMKSFGLQILNTTAAVLIALSLEGLVERQRIRQLVTTAHVHMDSEVRENTKDVVNMGRWCDQSLTGVKGMLKKVEDLSSRKREGRPPPSEEEAINVNLPVFSVVLNTTSRSTADAMGAMGHMQYADVKRYAAIYEYQRHVSRALERLDDQFLLVKGQILQDLTLLDLEQLKTVRTSLLDLAQLLTELKGKSQTLLNFYKTVTEGK